MKISSNTTSIGPTLKIAVLAGSIVSLQACSNSSTVTDPNANLGSDNPNMGAALPILLNSYPLNTVSLNEQNALNATSAVFRSQQVLTALAILTADVQTHADNAADDNSSLQSLGNDFCTSGDGSVQATTSPMFTGAENSVTISLNECAYLQTETSGDFEVAEFSDDSGDWTIVRLADVSLDIASGSVTETVTINSSYFRSRIVAGEQSTLSITTVGDAVDLIIGGYAIEAAPFESTISRNEAGTQITVDSRLSITTELLGGTIYGKNSIPLEIDNTGYATSGNFSVQGPDAAVIEWFTGTTVTVPDGMDESTTEVLADVRVPGNRTFVGNTWSEFLSAF